MRVSLYNIIILAVLGKYFTRVIYIDIMIFISTEY